MKQNEGERIRKELSALLESYGISNYTFVIKIEENFLASWSGNPETTLMMIELNKRHLLDKIANGNK